MKKSLKLFATSKWFDLLGVVLVVSIAIASGYLNSRLDQFVNWGPWTTLVPFGLISVTNVGISMLSTRFTGKLSKWGNYLGILNTVLSGTIDYILLDLHVCYSKMAKISRRQTKPTQQNTNETRRRFRYNFSLCLCVQYELHWLWR